MGHVIAYLKEKLLRKFLNQKIKINHTSEEKIFKIEKYSILGSPPLVQRALSIKYQSRIAPS